MTAPPRSVTTILAEIAEVRRYLPEMPPHHGGGRAALEQRLVRLEAELARARTSTAPPNAASAPPGTGSQTKEP